MPLKSQNSNEQEGRILLAISALKRILNSDYNKQYAIFRSLKQPSDDDYDITTQPEKHVIEHKITENRE